MLSAGAAAGVVLAASGCAPASEKKSDLEIHRDELIEYQELSRPEIERLLGAENYARCCAAMLAAYEQFANDLPVLKGSNNYNQFYHSAPFMLSLYRALRDDFGLPQDEALDMLLQITNYKVRKDYERQPVTGFFLAHVVDSALVRKLSLVKFQYTDEPYGWAVEFPQADAVMAVNFTRCGLAQWFAEQGVPEVAPIACQGDYVMAEFMKGLKLVRTQTLANGDPMCDFRYVKV
jgi:hypothetical protein